MRRAILTVALLPVAAGIAGYAAARTLAAYFENPMAVAERIADEAIEYFDQSAGAILGAAAETE